MCVGGGGGGGQTNGSWVIQKLRSAMNMHVVITTTNVMVIVFNDNHDMQMYMHSPTRP